MISNCALCSETPLSIDRNVSGFNAKKTRIFNLHLIKMETGHLIRSADQCMPVTKLKYLLTRSGSGARRLPAVSLGLR